MSVVRRDGKLAAFTLLGVGAGVLTGLSTESLVAAAAVSGVAFLAALFSLRARLLTDFRESRNAGDPRTGPRKTASDFYTGAGGVAACGSLLFVLALMREGWDPIGYALAALAAVAVALAGFQLYFIARLRSLGLIQ